MHESPFHFGSMTAAVALGTLQVVVCVPRTDITKRGEASGAVRAAPAAAASDAPTTTSANSGHIRLACPSHPSLIRVRMYHRPNDFLIPEPPSAQEPREPPVLEDSASGLALGAVVDRVLLEVHARDRRAAHVAGLIELVVDAVDVRVLCAALAQLEPALELRVDRLPQ